MSFVIRQFEESETVGKRLKAMRAATGLTLSELAAKTNIRKPYLAAFEADAFDKLPAPMYARQYLKTYAKALGGDPEYFVHRFEDERGTCDFLHASRLPVQRTHSSLFVVPSRWLAGAGLVTLLLAITGYLGFQVRQIVRAPDLMVVEPADGFATENAIVAVRGQTDPEARVSINGIQVLTDKNGQFTTDIQLERGLNVLEITGAKRYSRTSTIYRRIVLEEDEATASRALGNFARNP
jgi:transcriptional regulator with XRE-family HTH domain